MAKERKGKKLRRITASSKAYYKVQFGKTEDNQKRRMRMHIRSHPSDALAVKIYESVKSLGHPAGFTPKARGARRLERKGKRKAERAQRRARQWQAPVHWETPL